MLLLLLGLLLLAPQAMAQLCYWENYTSSDTSLNMAGCVADVRVFPPIPANFTEVISIEFSGNNLLEFPDLTPMGGSLRRIKMWQTSFQAIPDHLLAPLMTLDYVDFFSNSLTTFPNFTSSASTLRVLKMNTGPLAEAPAEKTTIFTAMEEFRMAGTKLAEFPDLRNSGANLTILRLGGGQLVTVPVDITQHFTVLVDVALRKNKITHFPDFSNAGSTLRDFDLTLNEIPEAPASITTHFTVLQRLRMGNNLLTEFPFLNNAGATLTELYLDNNQIASMAAELTSCLTVLVTFHVHNNQLTEFPDVTGSKETLKDLRVDGNSLTTITPKLLRPLVSLQKLNVSNNPLTTFPHIPGLTQLEYLDLSNTYITQIPPVWPQTPSLLELLLPDTALGLCSCRNLWLKEAQTTYSSVTFTDQTCKSGQLWSSYSMSDLRADCVHDKQQGRVRSLMMERASPAPQNASAQLVHSYLPAAPRAECTLTCFQTASCVGFWMGPAGCVLSAPSTSLVTVPGAGDTVWHFYGVIVQ